MALLFTWGAVLPAIVAMTQFVKTNYVALCCLKFATWFMNGITLGNLVDRGGMAFLRLKDLESENSVTQGYFGYEVLQKVLKSVIRNGEDSNLGTLYVRLHSVVDLFFDGA